MASCTNGRTLVQCACLSRRPLRTGSGSTEVLCSHMNFRLVMIAVIDQHWCIIIIIICCCCCCMVVSCCCETTSNAHPNSKLRYHHNALMILYFVTSTTLHILQGGMEQNSISKYHAVCFKVVGPYYSRATKINLHKPTFHVLFPFDVILRY